MALLEEVKGHYGRLNFFIDGEWLESRSEVVAEDPNPATGEPLSLIHI